MEHSLVENRTIITEKEAIIHHCLLTLLNEYKANPVIIVSVTRKVSKRVLESQSQHISAMFRDIEYIINTKYDKEDICIDYTTHIICKVFNTSIEKLRAKNKKNGLPLARQFLTYFLDQKKVSYSRILTHLDYKNHASIIHNLRTIKGLLETRNHNIVELNEKIKNELLINSYLNEK